MRRRIYPFKMNEQERSLFTEAQKKLGLSALAEFLRMAATEKAKKVLRK